VLVCQAQDPKLYCGVYRTHIANGSSEYIGELCAGCRWLNPGAAAAVKERRLRLGIMDPKDFKPLVKRRMV
jgi:hypothetical protein